MAKRKTSLLEESVLLDASTASAWERLSAIFADRKVTPAELPDLLQVGGEVLQSIAVMLQAVPSMDPRVKIIIGLVAKAITMVAVSLKAQAPKLIAAWEVIEAGKGGPRVIAAWADVIEASLAVAIPFLNLEFSDTANDAVRLLKRIAGFLSPRSKLELNRALPK